MAVDLYADEWDEEEDVEGYRGRARSVSKALGATALGATLYELEPGSRNCAYHWHAAEEEWLLVVAGEPTVRTPERERRLRPGDVVCFPCGPEGAHVVANRTDERVRFLLLSNLAEVEVAVYPDSGKVGAWTPYGVKLMNRPEANLAYLDGEP